MSDTDGKELMEKYWFFHPEKGPHESLMCFGIMCGDGWLPMLDELCSKIDKIITEKYPEFKTGPVPFEVIEVKEKYGGLRFYTSPANDEIFKIIDKYEKKSVSICELCGNKGKIRDISGWYQALCTPCYKEAKLKREKEMEGIMSGWG